MTTQHLLDDAIHMAVCQSINLDFDDIEEREKEVKKMLQDALCAAIERAKPQPGPEHEWHEELKEWEEDDGTIARWPRKVRTIFPQGAYDEYETNLKRELGLEDA